MDSTRRVIIWKIIVFYLFVDLATTDKFRWKNHKVITTPRITNEQMKNLTTLALGVNGMYFQGIPLYTGEAYAFLVSPSKLVSFYDMMNQMGLSYQIVIQNLFDWITKVKTNHLGSLFNFTRYQTLQEIYESLDKLAIRYPNITQVIEAGRTYQGRVIKGVKLSFRPISFKYYSNSPGIFIEGGIHGNEWISPATVIYILLQLLISNDTNVRELAGRHNWYIFPIFNPDGYELTHTIKTKRHWKKTVKQHGKFCYGVDLDSNWSYKWLGLHGYSCPNDYPGSAPFSETESLTMARYINSISNYFYAYISFQSYGQYLLFPYCYTSQHFENYNESYSIAMKAVTALKERYGTEYQVGSVAEMLPRRPGCTVDYIQGIYKKRLVYQYVLPDRGQYGFHLPPEEIIPTGEEILDSLVAMFKEAVAKGYHRIS